MVMATFACDAGRVLVGQSRLKCRDGQWSDSIPVCAGDSPGGAVGGFLFSQMTDLQGWRLFFYISLRVSDTYTPWLQEKIPKNFQKCQIVFTLDKQYI